MAQSELGLNDILNGSPDEIYSRAHGVFGPIYEQGQIICESDPLHILMADHTYGHAHRTAIFAERLLAETHYTNERDRIDDIAMTRAAMLLHDLGLVKGRENHEEELAVVISGLVSNAFDSDIGRNIIHIATMHNGNGYRRLLGEHGSAPYATRRQVLISTMQKSVAAAHNADKLDVGRQRVNYWNLRPKHFDREPDRANHSSYEHLVAQAYSRLARFGYDDDSRIFTVEQIFEPYIREGDPSLNSFSHVILNPHEYNGQKIYPLMCPASMRGRDNMVDFSVYHKWQRIVLGDKFKRLGDVSNVLYPEMEALRIRYIDSEENVLDSVTLGSENFDDYFKVWCQS